MIKLQDFILSEISGHMIMFVLKEKVRLMSKKIKVLRILNRFNLGGPIYNAAYLSKYLNSKKYETYLIGGKIEKHETSGKFMMRKS